MGNVQLSKHTWMITGDNKSKFPSGTAVFIQTQHHRVLVDTNPGYSLIEQFLQNVKNLHVEDITDIILTHAHLDHVKGLGQVFEKAQTNLWGLPDTLQRCEDSRRIGMYAGIPPEEIQHFVNFGQAEGFITRSYPAGLKKPIPPGHPIVFDSVFIKPHVTDAHALRVLDLEIIDDDLHLLISQDYDFTPVPWYGVPQRGAAVLNFIRETREMVAKQPDLIISSHRKNPIKRQEQESELSKYVKVISSRTDQAVTGLSKLGTVQLLEMPEFIYPTSKMGGKYSADYIRLGEIWDRWILLAHLEDAWRQGRVECVDAGGDPFLRECINSGAYNPELVEEYLTRKWCEQTLILRPPYTIPVESTWRVL